MAKRIFPVRDFYAVCLLDFGFAEDGVMRTGRLHGILPCLAWSYLAEVAAQFADLAREVEP